MDLSAEVDPADDLDMEITSLVAFVAVATELAAAIEKFVTVAERLYPMAVRAAHNRPPDAPAPGER